MSSISKKTKNIFKNKIVLYSVIALTVIAIGIVVWGVVTDWKFLNTKKSPPIPDYPIHHSCHPRFCKKCDSSGKRCQKGECIEGTENINGYCFKTPTHPCSDKKCAKCSTDGKKCETCASGYVLDDNGKCCSNHEKINGVCCVEPCGGKCCPKGKLCMTSKRKNATGCCLPSQSLDNDGNCCPADKIDDAGNCCDKGTLCGTEGNKYCCGNTGENTCENNECKLKCGGSTCNADQNCEYVNGTKKCITKSCEWNGDQTTYYPQLIYSTPKECKKDNECPYGICDTKTGLCQYYPIGLVPKGDSAENVLKKNVHFKEDGLGNPYLFLFASGEVNASKYRFSKVKSRSSTHTNIKCGEDDCRKELGIDDASETVYFNDKTSECLVEEQTAVGEQDPSSEKICPFKDETGDNSKRCCINDNGNWSGQVCDKGNECVYDKTKGIGTCLPYNTYTDQNGKICGEDDVQKGLNKIKYKKENGKKIGYCDCGSGKEHLNEFKCTLPSGCFFPGIKNIAPPSKKLCGDVGTCKESHSGYNCICPKYYDQDYYCEGSDTDDCRSDYSKGEVGDWLTGRYYLAYQEIALNRNGKCGDNNKICKDDCCNNIKEYCRHQITTDAGVKQCEKDRGC